MVSESQQKAIAHIEGPMAVIAGPGAGKTTVLTQRLQHLVTVGGIDPASILVITFTRAAAQEMEERYRRLMGPREEAEGIRFGTFHAVFLEWLQRWGFFCDRKVLTEEDKLGLLAPFFRDAADTPEEETREQIARFFNEYDRYRNEGRDLSEIPAFFCCQRDIFVQAVAYYQRVKDEGGLMDYEDMQQALWELLEREPERIDEIRRQYRYYLVDEFQDINPIQYSLLQKMAAGSRNLFVVGDEDQSIYGFRGSSPGFLLRFPKDYPEGKVVVLEENYRCRAPIVALSKKLIEHNRERYPKCLKAAREGKGTIPIRYWPMPEREAIAIRDDVAMLHHRRGISYDEMAILYRTNARSRLLRRALADAGLPYHSEEEDYQELSHWTVTDMELCWRLRENPEDADAFCRLAHCLAVPGFIQEEALQYGGDLMQALGKIHRLSAGQRERAEEFVYHYRRLRRLDFAEAISYWWTHTGYREYLRAYEKKEFLPHHYMRARARRMWTLAQDCRCLEDWKRKKEELPAKPEERITLSTMHGAKGLEFKAVWCAAVSEGILPHDQAEELEEERRILYVGLTRAKDILRVSGYGAAGRESSFFRELKNSGI